MGYHVNNLLFCFFFARIAHVSSTNVSRSSVFSTRLSVSKSGSTKNHPSSASFSNYGFSTTTPGINYGYYGHQVGNKSAGRFRGQQQNVKTLLLSEVPPVQPVDLTMRAFPELVQDDAHIMAASNIMPLVPDPAGYNIRPLHSAAHVDPILPSPGDAGLGWTGQVKHDDRKEKPPSHVPSQSASMNYITVETELSFPQASNQASPQSYMKR